MLVVVIDASWAKGIDVNHWHPVQDWRQVPSDIVIFGAKATEANSVTDGYIEMHRDGARERGFDLVCYYHVAAPGDPKAHAQRLAEVIGPLLPNESLVLDVERGSHVDVAYVDGFYDELERQGLTSCYDLFYGSRDVWELLGGGGWARAAAGKVGLWAPRYKSHGMPPHLPQPWNDWKLWQWTDGGATGDPYSCPGVGVCDANVFNGDRAALQSWINGGSPR